MSVAHQAEKALMPAKITLARQHDCSTVRPCALTSYSMADRAKCHKSHEKRLPALSVN